MTWNQCIEIMKEEKKAVARPHWTSESVIMVENWSAPGNADYYPHGFPALRTPEKFLVPWFGNVSDYLAVDWKIVE